VGIISEGEAMSSSARSASVEPEPTLSSKDNEGMDAERPPGMSWAIGDNSVGGDGRDEEG